LADRIDRLMIAVLLPDDRERMPLLAEHLAPDFVYVHPTAVAEGAEGLSDVYRQFRHDQWLHFSLRRTSEVDIHHAHFRYSWESRLGDETVTRGWSFGWVDADGKLSRIVAFDDPVLARLPADGTGR
jgi:hypothetical protein